MTQMVRVYREDPLQADYYNIADKLIYVTNKSRDSTRKEDSFYLLSSLYTERHDGVDTSDDIQE